jgi:hypothetical protein
MMTLKRLPIRGQLWVLACKPLGAIVFGWKPRFVFQVLGMNDRFKPPAWIEWRIK